MRMVEVLTLRSIATTSGVNCEPMQTVTTTTVYAEPKGVKRSEYYAAQAAGQTVDAIFEVNTEEYTGQKEAVYAGVTYKIVRSYPINQMRTELICRR